MSTSLVQRGRLQFNYMKDEIVTDRTSNRSYLEIKMGTFNVKIESMALVI